MSIAKRRFALFVLPSVLSAALLLAACSTSGGVSSTVTITGSISDSATSPHPVIALFDASTYMFSNFGSGDTATPTAGTAPYPPVKTATISGGSYSITLPAGTSGAGYYLVAWDDSTANGVLDSSETAYYPIKSFPEGSAPMTEIGYVSYQGQGEYTADYYINPTNYYEGFSIVGTTGYNFSF